MSATFDVVYSQLGVFSQALDFPLDERESYMDFNNVRITPCSMIFKDAFEGKSYYQKVTLQNCGKVSAFIRIGQATSSSFHIKSLIRGRHLPPGLIITRYVKYTYMRATSVPLSWIPISINKKRLDYKLKVLLSNVLISAIPQQLDFGTIDAGCSAAVRMFSLRNDGSKGTRFAIDLGTNDIQLIVQPYKGIIQPHDIVNFRVECLGTQEGLFSREFWVKCETPIRIDVQVKVLNQKLQSFHPDTINDFTMINFGRTYFGNTVTRTSVVRNISGSPTVFCILGDISNVPMSLNEARIRNPLYNDFLITPLAGTWLPAEGEIFHFTYKPIHAEAYEIKNRMEKISHCSLRISRLPCANLCDMHFGVNIEKLETYRAEIDDSVSIKSELFSFEEDPETSSGDVNKLEVYQIPAVSLPSFVRVFLYGEAIEAKIGLRPDALHLQDVQSNLEITRELLITNESWELPITIEYKKVCYVNVEPSIKYLQPMEQFEVCVKILTAQLGKVSTKIRFDMLYYNEPRESNDCVCVGHAEIPLTFNVVPAPVRIKQKFNTGITPEYIREVGFNVDDVRFNSAIIPPRATLIDKFRREHCKADDAIIAFPNDRPQNLRPWKSATPCRTICAGIPRGVDQTRDQYYQLSKSFSNLKHEQYGYYQKYTREEGARLRMHIPVNKKASDYDISSKKMLLLDYSINPKCKKIQFLGQKKKLGVIPLTPLQLGMVKVYPASVHVGKVGANTRSTATITVANDNDFVIEILVRGRKPLISIPNGDHKVLKQHSKVEILLVYESPSSLGRSIVTIDFIVNSTHTFMVSMTADVFPKFAKCFDTEVIFLSNEDCYKFLNVHNILNVPIEFDWDVPESCFNFFPLHGVIPPRCFLTSMVQYSPNNQLPNSAGVSLKSGTDAYQQTVNIVSDMLLPNVEFKVSKVEFKDVPLNISVEKKIVLTNFDRAPVTYTVCNAEPIDGISINPVEGILEGHAEQILVIQVKIPACIQFTCTIEVEIQMAKSIEFVITGNIIYPNISFKPDVVRLRKIVADSIDHQKFLIINKTNAKAYVEFDMEDYTEYAIMKHNHISYNSIPVTKVDLEANETKQLYIFFRPMGAASYSFFLPYIINGVIGPVVISNPASSKPIFFFEDVIKIYKEIDTIKTIDLPKKLPVINVYSNVGGDMLRFSKLHLKFKYFSDVTYISETLIDFKIWNASKDNCKFCLRTDELDPPFYLTYFNGNEVERLQYSIVCTLGPSEWVTLKAEFRPSIPGTYHIKLPIYVKNYLECHVFNYINFTGIYPAPKIYPSETIINFDPVVLRCESEYNLELRTEFHKPNCEIYATCEICEIVIIISKEPTFIEQTFFKKISVVLKFSSRTPRSFNSTLMFYCSCDSVVEIAVSGCADNCIATTYPFAKSYIKFLLSQLAIANLPKASIVTNASYTEPLFTTLTSTKGYLEENTETTSTFLDSPPYFDFIINYTDSTFPLFPEPNNPTEHARYLFKVLTAVEEWLYNQGFFCKSYFKIPEGIAAMPDPIVVDEKAAKNKKKKDSEEFALLNYVQLLVTLVGTQISDYIPIKKIPDDDVQRINYMYNVYFKAKEFLINHGGFLPHVVPEYLLEYNDYVFFIENISLMRTDCREICRSRLLDNYTYFLISKQCWLDMILQTYKVLVLARIRGPSRFTEIDSNETRNSDGNLSMNKLEIVRGSSGSQVSLSNDVTAQNLSLNLIYPTKDDSKFNIIDDINFWHEFNETDTKNTNIFSQPEVILLFWLEYHFNRSKDKLLHENHFNYHIEDIPKKVVRYFETDLIDGLLLIGVTSTYCPYILPHLRDIYLNPTTIEQKFHNAAQIVQCWSKLKLSFHITPFEIIDPNSVKMMLLVAYLYEVLPYFYPSQTLCLHAPLSGSVTEDISIENVNDFPICYQIIFVNNHAELISAPFSTIVIAPKQKGKIPIKFYAKFAINENITLILNGGMPKFRYAKSMAFTINAKSDMSYATSTLTIPVQLYKVVDMELSIQSPYAEAATYGIFYSYLEPMCISTCMLYSSLHDRTVIPRRVVIFQEHLECDDSGIGILNVTFATITSESKTFWIVFRDASVGDFTIKVIHVCDTSVVMYEVIDVEIPKRLDEMRCTCKCNPTTCKRNIPIRLPCFNLYLYNTFIAIMIKLSKTENDAKFWKRHIASGGGRQLLIWLMNLVRTDFTEEISQVLNSFKTYYITSTIKLPPSTIIPNVTHPIKHEIPYHVDYGEVPPAMAYATLESSSRLELRNYELRFIKEP